MDSLSTLVELVSRKLDQWTFPAKDWARSEGRPLLCSKCWKLKPDIYPSPVDIRLRHLETGTSYDSVFRGGVAVIHETLLEWLCPYMHNYVLGKCMWEDGRSLIGYHSIYLRDTILIRGAHDAQYFVCEVCGHMTCVWGETPYVLRSELPDGDVFQDAVRGLCLKASLLDAFPWKRFPDLRALRFPVRDEPLRDDPMPAFPEDDPKKQHPENS